MTPSRWTGEHRDFLLGDADRPSALIEADLRRVISALDDAHGAGIRVLLVPLTLPGSRWRQHHGTDDLRIWTDFAWHERAAAVWAELAAAVRDHPALAGYELLNEPHPQRLTGTDLHGEAARRWAASVRGTPADLGAFNRRCIDAIRRVDASGPIVVSSGMYGAADAFADLEPFDDPAVLYTFHVYEPFAYTNWPSNRGRLRYPSVVPRGWLRRHVEPVAAWQRRHDVPASQVLLGEFGCNRRCPGAEHYLGDIVNLALDHRWHWAFYAYREDTWPGMDYEVGPGALPAEYWAELEAGRRPQPPRRDNPLFDVLRRGIARTTSSRA